MHDGAGVSAATNKYDLHFICCSQIFYFLQPNISFAAAKYLICCSQIFNLLQPNSSYAAAKILFAAAKYFICCNQNII